MATPLINPLRVAGGTFYTFNSAALDISKTFSDDNFRFTFSKIAALDIPTVRIPNNNENTISWQALGNSTNTGGSFDSVVLNDLLNGVQQNNVHLANSFQNYVLNQEELILTTENSDGNTFDNQEKQTITERLFWKWLINIGALRFKNADPEATDQSNLYQEETENTEATNGDLYNPVVKYLGDIDLVNNIKNGGQAYTEVYLHIPTTHGSTPDVLFKTVSDNNYQPTLRWDGSANEIEGRTSHPDNRMSVRAYFDDNLNNSYSTGNSFGDVTNQLIQLATDVNETNTFQMKRSNMDGISIEWDASNYKRITDNPDITLLSEFNTVPEAEDFRFNAVLVYYDTFNVNTPSETRRNLYGVLFIEDFEETIADGATIQQFPKFKPNQITRLNGNSYGLKLNVKFDTSADNVGIEKVINEYNTFSMDLYSDAVIQLQETLDQFTQINTKVLDLSDKVSNLENFTFTQDTIDVIKNDIQELRDIITNSSLNLDNRDSILDLIANNAQRINTLLTGGLTEDLTYDLAPFASGNGINIDKRVANRIIINNTVQSFNNIAQVNNTIGYLNYEVGNGVTDTNNIDFSTKNNILYLNQFSNYFRNKTPEQAINNNLVININDTDHIWQTGQSYRISLSNRMIYNENFDLIIYTDAPNRRNLGSYRWQIARIPFTELNQQWIIDIICTDSDRYIFEVDIIK